MDGRVPEDMTVYIMEDQLEAGRGVIRMLRSMAVHLKPWLWEHLEVGRGVEVMLR